MDLDDDFDPTYLSRDTTAERYDAWVDEQLMQEDD